MSTPRYGPPDALTVPRYSGVRTFARLPHVTDFADVDVAVFGAPFDTTTSFRSGARFGPSAIREMSHLLRRWHPVHEIDIFGTLSVVDAGDVATTPGNAERTLRQITDGIAPAISAGAKTLVLGGDHTVVLGELRAHAAAHGPLGVILIDAHTDTGDAYFGERFAHGTPFRRAIEEGLVDPKRVIMAGMRGGLYDGTDRGEPRSWGIEIISCEELRTLTPAEYAARVRARIGSGPTYLSFDIDVLDPAFAPGTGVPEAGGLATHEAFSLLRGLAGIELVGCDIVEVAPQYDGPGQITAVAAANVGFELLALMAVAKAGSADA